MICDGALGLESVLSLLARIKVILGVKLWRFCRCHLILRVRPWFWIRRSILPRRQILLFDIFHGLDAVRGNEFFGFPTKPQIPTATSTAPAIMAMALLASLFITDLLSDFSSIARHRTIVKYGNLIYDIGYVSLDFFAIINIQLFSYSTIIGTFIFYYFADLFSDKLIFLNFLELSRIQLLLFGILE